MEKDFFFVKRPTLAIVISIVLVIFGLVAMRKLPISQYPEVIPPEIQVNSTYTGADAVALEGSVTAPLEQKINGVENMIYMRSINADDGTSSIRITFKVGSNLDMSNVLTQNRTSEAEPTLPEEVKRMGVTVKKSLSFPLVLVTLTSPNATYDSSFLSNYAGINITDAISRISGVGQVVLFGGSDYSMRIWVKPDQLKNLGISVSDIIKAIKAQSNIAPGGKIGAPPSPPGTEFTYAVKLTGRLTLPEEFEQVIVKSSPDGSLIRVKDIARVELGSQNYNSTGRFNGEQAAVMAVYQIPGSNALEVKSKIQETMDEISSSFPDDLSYRLSLDTTKAVTAGINEIAHTLLEALILVILVTYLFLQSWRATLIPILVVPVALIATFAIFPLIGFSINTLSLLGLVLAIGIVVDDAIVVVEAVMHHIEHGLSPREATNKAMSEVSGPVVAMSLILSAVFLPAVFMEGITGSFFMQFAVTIAVSVLFSALGALTLSPALCSLLLKPATPNNGLLGRFFTGFNNAFNRSTNVYGSLAEGFIRKGRRTVIFFAVIIIGIIFFGKELPTGFVPEEDQGYILANLTMPEGTALPVTTKFAEQVEQIIRDNAGIDSVTTVGGFSLITQSYSSNSSFYFIWLKDWKDREFTSAEIIADINKKLAVKIQAGQAFAFGPPAIPGLGTGSGFSMMLQDRQGKSPQYLYEQAQLFIEAARKRPEIGRITTAYNSATPQVFIHTDREKLYKQGVNLEDLNQTVGTFLGGTYVNDFNRFGRLYKVFLQAESEYRDTTDDIRQFYVRNNNGEMLPVSSIAHAEKISGPAFTNRFNLYRSAELIGAPAPGYSSNEALAALEETAAAVLPADMSYAWNAMSYQEKNSGGGIFVLILGAVFVFLILAAQYESWSLPFSVLLGSPFAILGAYGGLWLARQLAGDSYLNNIYTQIGLLTLIGLAAKNAILIVEFARSETKKGTPVIEAAISAAKLRFRPILMTAFAFILGVVPLLTASGSGAEGRKVIGMSVFSGMGVATIIGVLLIPALFVFIEKLSNSGATEKPASTPEDKHI